MLIEAARVTEHHLDRWLRLTPVQGFRLRSWLWLHGRVLSAHIVRSNIAFGNHYDVELRIEQR